MLRFCVEVLGYNLYSPFNLTSTSPYEEHAMPFTDLRDAHQFDEAYKRLQPLALASANRVLRDEAAAEDVVQDVFVQLWLRPDMYDASRGSLSSYVSMLARSRALDRWRSRSAREGATERAEEAAKVEAQVTESAAEPVLRREVSRTLLTALASLPGDQRDALLLAYGRGLTAQEIARVREVPLGTAKSRVRLGLRKARAELQTEAVAA
jgi:RNA polymerase sigma-70 factor (ECF subfamily)